MAPRLAVIIVSYNVRDLLRNCLRSVQASAARCTGKLDVDLLVIDNASHDGSVAMVHAEFPEACLVALDENLGFTGGNNLALSLLGFNVPTPISPPPHCPTALPTPDYVLLLNPDAEIVGVALWRMVDFLERTPSAGVCGARLAYGDGSFQHGAYQYPTVAQVVLDLFPLPQVRGMHRLHDSRFNGRYPASLWQGVDPFSVDFVLGAALMARAEAIEAAGGLDDAYFMYCEEMDWCLRMGDAGWMTYAVPAAQVIHHAGQSSQQVRWPAFEWLWRSRFRFFEKHRSHYSSADLVLLRGVVRVAMRVRAASARRRFAHGKITGTELGEELAAYTSVARSAADERR